MLRGILFNDEKYFESSDDNNLMDTLTENTIILCVDNKVKNFLYDAIRGICEGKHKEGGYEYYVEDTDKLNLKVGISYLPTAELYIDDEQKIILTMEVPYILTAKQPEDIWFAQRNRDNKIVIYPMKIFKGYKEKWEEGIEAVYRYIAQGRYGDYKYGNIVETEIGQ